jgi:GNAT superfamily N-acetyltransferase
LAGSDKAVGIALHSAAKDAVTGTQNIKVIRVGPEFAAQALRVLREAAAWAISRGVEVWTDAELREQDFVTAAGLGQLVMGFCGGRPAAAMLLQPSDAVYWPNAAPHSALYLHKIAVLREFAGRGWLTRLIDFAANEARDRGIPHLRLDTLCKSPLQDLYARHGFALVDEAPLVVHGRLMIRMERVLV